MGVPTSVVNGGGGNSGSNSAMTQGEGALESPSANAMDGTVQTGLYIGAAAVFVIALIVAGTYFALKKKNVNERFVNNVMNSMRDLELEAHDGHSFEIGASQDLEALADGGMTPSTGFAE